MLTFVSNAPFAGGRIPTETGMPLATPLELANTLSRITISLLRAGPGDDPDCPAITRIPDFAPGEGAWRPVMRTDARVKLEARTSNRTNTFVASMVSVG